jgi:hypothetical protein
VVAPTGIITWQDGEVFQGRMLHDRPCEGKLTYADGSSAQVEYSRNCDDLFSGYKPTPKKPSPQKDLGKRQISESPKSTSLSAGEGGSNSKQQRKRAVTLTTITGDRADVQKQRQREQEHQREEQLNPSKDPHVGNAVSNGVHADLKPCSVSGCGVTGDGGTADDAVRHVPRWLQEVMNADKITVLREVMRREQVQESDLEFFNEATLKEAGLVQAILTSYAKILREIRDPSNSPEGRGGGRKDDGPQTPGKGKAKPFEQWSVDEVSRLIKSIDGVGYAEAADVVKEIGINGKYFADMLRNNDEDLTKSIADEGLGFKNLQLKLVKAKIAESQAAES